MEIIDVSTNDLQLNNDNLLSSLSVMLSGSSSFSEDLLEIADRTVTNILPWYGYAGYSPDEDTFIIVYSPMYSYDSELGIISFGSPSTIVSISKNYTNETDYTIGYSVSETSSTNFEVQDLMFTNILPGYPSLGSETIDYSLFAGIGIFCVVLLTVFTRIRRR